MNREDWVALSLDGEVDEAFRVQGLTSIESRLTLAEWSFQETEDLLPLKPTPRTECPGFERLAAIMDIVPTEIETIEPTLIAPAQTAAWAAAMRRSNQ